jgi:hypothetical protein
MPGTLWRETTVRILSEKIGPQASTVVDQALAACGVTESQVTAVHFVDLVRVLYDKLPPSVDRRALCRSVTASILQAYGFPSAAR